MTTSDPARRKWIMTWRFHVWLVLRLVASGRRLLNLPSMMALIGMSLGVASLTVAMGVVSGYESTLKTAIIDVFGHVMLVKRGEQPQTVESITGLIKQVAPEAESYTPFVNLEGMIVGGGRLSGVMLQGVDGKSVDQVLNIRSRLINGKFEFGRAQDLPLALMGKTLAKKFNLQPGSTFKVVLPVPSKVDSAGFSPKVQTFVLGGILDLGKAEYDERTIMTDLRTAQEFGGLGDHFSGIRIKLKNANRAPEVATRLVRQLGMNYWSMDWTDVNKNLFEAVKIERIAIFFVILIMVIAASFNIASNLFVSVLKKYGDISILRAMGLAASDIRRIFIVQGLFFGVVGTFVGLVLGLLLGLGFEVLQRYVVLLPVEAYRLDHVGVEFRTIDLFFVIIASILVCLLSTLIPARRGAKLDPVEGLRYE